jgi:hypothetical protein
MVLPTMKKQLSSATQNNDSSSLLAAMKSGLGTIGKTLLRGLLSARTYSGK